MCFALITCIYFLHFDLALQKRLREGDACISFTHPAQCKQLSKYNHLYLFDSHVLTNSLRCLPEPGRQGLISKLHCYWPEIP